MDILKVCCICKNNNELTLKSFKEAQWRTVKNAANRRKLLQSDLFATVTDEIASADEFQVRSYHSNCLSRFCAVKKAIYDR